MSFSNTRGRLAFNLSFVFNAIVESAFSNQLIEIVPKNWFVCQMRGRIAFINYSTFSRSNKCGSFFQESLMSSINEGALHYDFNFIFDIN